jgi:hypothetical protein
VLTDAFCGIPKFTLRILDNKKLQEEVVQLCQLDLDMDFWLNTRLDPVVWKLVGNL